MDTSKNDKTERILGIYTRLLNGDVVNKVQEAQRYGVNERSIQRDIDDIRNYLENDAVDTGFLNSVIYDRAKNGYCMEQIYRIKLTNSEVLAVCKILLDSRAFLKSEMEDILKRLVSCCVPKTNQRLVTDLISNEAFYYVEPRHRKKFMDTMWLVGQAIRGCFYLEIMYERTKDRRIVMRKVKPVGIMFSEYYFYMTAFIDDEDEARKDFDVLNDSFPTIYRIDRIQNLKILKERFHIPYSSRFVEGEFRKRIQFMYGGRLQKVRFCYTGTDIDAILDRLPTAVILEEQKGAYIVEAEVFGKGIDMWLRSQGETVKIIKREEK